MYYVRNIEFKKVKNNYYKRIQAASLIFGSGNKQSMVTSMLNAYGDYFDYEQEGRRGGIRPNYNKLYESHRDIWGETKEQSSQFAISNLILALEDEKTAYRNHQQKNFVSLSTPQHIGTVNQVLIYSATVLLEADDTVVQLPEGVKVRYQNQGFSTDVTVLEYDSKSNTVVFQTSYQLPTTGIPKLENSPIFLLNNMIKRLEGMELENVHFRALFTRPSQKNISDKFSTYEGNLTTSQRAAQRYCLQYGISYIWGPPGTGKSHTLATLLLNLYLRNERTLICTIANVAVDGLTKKLVSTIEEYAKEKRTASLLKQGKILRIGHVHDKELKKVDALFPDDDLIKQQRAIVLKAEAKLLQLRKESNAYKLQLSTIEQENRKLTTLLKEKIEKALMVFTSSSKALLEPAIADTAFDNLVIDEASMMSQPYLLSLLKNVTKRVIITGDFRQLGPIALANTRLADLYLKRDLFQLLGEGDSIARHPFVNMLKEQRRSAPAIVDLINHTFYGGELTTVCHEGHLAYKNVGVGSSHVYFLDLTRDPEYRAAYSSNHSRYNKRSQHYTFQLLRRCIANRNIRSVGIITPYRSQVFQYKKELELYRDKVRPSFRIDVGTIHSFQGSECDVIIFDMVDALLNTEGQKMNIGSLYHKDTGERLLNVAISRAISKLIIVGCSKVLAEGEKRDQVSVKIKRIIAKAKADSLD